MTQHRLQRIDFQRPSRFTAVCTCTWRSQPMLNAGLAGSLWDRHVEDLPEVAPTQPAPVVDVDMTVGDASRELYADVLPPIKDAVRTGHALEVTDAIERMEELATVLGGREHRLAKAVRREWTRLVEDDSSRQRATVIVGLVELGERAREHLSRGLPCAPDPLHAASRD